MKQWTDKDICRHYRFKDQSIKQSVNCTDVEKHKDDFIELSEDNHAGGDIFWVTIKDSGFSPNGELGPLSFKFPSIAVSRKQAAKLARLFEHFAVNGTLPVPKRQDVVEEKID